MYIRTNLQGCPGSQCNTRTSIIAQRWFGLLQEENTWKVFLSYSEKKFGKYMWRGGRGEGRENIRQLNPFIYNEIQGFTWFELFSYSAHGREGEDICCLADKNLLFMHEWLGMLVRELRILLCFFSFSYSEWWKWWSTRDFVCVQAFTCILQYIQSLNWRSSKY